MAQSLNQKVKNFTTRNRNAGAKGLELVAECINHMFDHKDWTPLAWLIVGSEGRDATIFRKIVGVTTEGVTLAKDAKQPTGLRFTLKDNASTTELFDTLKALVNDGESFRGENVKNKLFPTTESTFDINAYAKRVMSKIEKEHVSLGDLLAAIEREAKEERAKAA